MQQRVGEEQRSAVARVLGCVESALYSWTNLCSRSPGTSWYPCLPPQSQPHPQPGNNHQHQDTGHHQGRGAQLVKGWGLGPPPPGRTPVMWGLLKLRRVALQCSCAGLLSRAAEHCVTRPAAASQATRSALSQTLQGITAALQREEAPPAQARAAPN